MKHLLVSVRGVAVVVLVAGLITPVTALAATHVVRDGELIQDAVDAASPGDTIVVKKGTYFAPPGEFEYVVEVDKDDITLIGHPQAVIEATGIRYGVMVGEDIDITPAGCPPPSVRNFRIKGFTIQNAAHTGVRLEGVDGYRMSHGTYLNNDEYGPFPICSTHGRIDHNFASGHNDAAIYVGDDDGILVDHNVTIDNSIGIEIENSSNAEIRNNVVEKNTAGILVIVLPGLPMPFTENVEIHHNRIDDNNRDNSGGGFVALLPVGTGILNVGGDNLHVHHNTITRNDSFGYASIGNPFGILFGDPRIEPFVDGQVVRKNTIVDNGDDPDPMNALTPGADIVFIPDVVDPFTGMIILTDPDPTDNCFEKNDFDVDFPPGVVSAFPCP